MNNSEFYTLRDECYELLSKGNLLDAIKRLEDAARVIGRASLMEEARLLHQDYTMLLGVTKEEFFTINRADYFYEVMQKAYALCDDISRFFALHYSDLAVAAVWRRLKLPAERLADIYVPVVEGVNGRPPTMSAVLADPLASYLQQFDVVWSSPRWEANERRLLLACITDDERPSLNRLTLVGATGLGLLTFYDAEKFHLLLDLLHPECVELSVRAALMIVFALSRYHSRVVMDANLKSRLDAFFADETYHPLLRSIQKAIAAVVESPSISKHLEEGMSEALAKKSEVDEIAQQDSIEDVEQLIENDPRLKKFHQGMMDLVQDFVSMHMRGIDINFSSFRAIPDMLPFFQEAANWFCPFSLDHPLLLNINAALRFLGIMSQEKSCNTDRYAMVLAMEPHIPEIHIVKHDAETDEETTIETKDVDEVVEHLAESVETIAESKRRSLVDIQDKYLYPIVVCVVQDCFRFFTLFPAVGEDTDPFVGFSALWSWDNPYSSTLYSQPAHIRAMADWYFDLDRYSEACQLYRQLHEEGDVDVLRRLGFIYTQQDRYARAYAAFESALLLDPDDEWTLLQQAFVCFKLKRLDEAVAVNRRLLKLFPDNVRYERSLGDYLLHQENFKEALPIFVKLDYLHPDSRATLRGLSWAHLGLGNYSEAARIYDRLLSDPTASSDDYLNAGHCALLQGDCTSAVAYYQQSIKLADESRTADNLFTPDYFFLINRGIDAVTQQMLVDMIKM